MEFCSCCLLLKFGFFQSSFSSEFFQLFPDLLVFSLNVEEIAFPCVEIMLIFPAIKSSVVLLYDLRLFVEKFALLVLLLLLLLKHKLTTANIPSPYLLNFLNRPPLVIEVPLDLKHSPTLLNDYSCGILFVSELFSLIYHIVVLINKVTMSLLPFFEVYSHD